MKLKIRINELARELEVKPNIILEMLPELGVQEKKTHSSSIDEDVAIAIKHRLSDLPSAGSERYRSRDEGGVAVAVDDDYQEEEHEDRDGHEREEREERSAPAFSRQASSPERESESAGESVSDGNGSGPVVREEAPATAPSDNDQGSSQARTRAMPLRPPLAGSLRPPLAPPSSLQPPRTSPAQPRPPAPPSVPSMPLPARPSPAPTASPAQPAPQQARSQPASPSTQPASPVPGAPQPRRDVPLFRPGQVISPGPRQPAADRPGPEARMPGPGAPRPAGPAPGAPRIPPPRPAPPSAAPGAPRPQAAPPPASAPGPQGQRPLVGQPAARPVVPPRPDLVERIRQTRPAPGAPAAPPPRPGMPQQRPPLPAAGQPIYGRPPGARTGQPFARTGPGGPGRPGGPVGPGGLGRRPMHPTTPLRPEPATPVPGETQRRLQSKGRPALSVEQRKREAEGKLRAPDPRSKAQPLPVVNKEITIGEGITVKELAEKLGVKSSLVIKQLFDRKIFATINQTLDLKLAQELARDFGATTSTLSFEEEAMWEVELAEKEEDVQIRPPVVTVMGHVDHGKTSLLDAIRSTNVAAREAGGITQHIGASVVEQNGKRIIFIDTPGHEAFTRMRARGAKVTDIVILVVAADDGVMPQTVEAIDHARAAKVPIIVAINKIDKPEAQIDRIKQQLADRGLLAEDWGGDTVMVPVSARTRENLDTLLEMVLLVADLANLKSNPTRPGVGTVLEAELDRGRGPVATVLVQNGTLRVGDFFICGQVFGKVRAMYDHLGAQVRDAGPSTPVEVLGLEALPEVGDGLQVVSDTAKAKQIVMYRENKSREQAMSKGARLTLEQFNVQAKEGDVKDLNIIVKTDVGGTAEVLSEMLQKLSTEKVRVRVIAKNVGAITESDVLLSAASNAIIIGFNVRPERNAATLAEKEKVDVRLHTIIYELTDEIKKAMTGMLAPVFKEVFRGRADVRDVFHISKVGNVAGCYITEGTFTRDSQVRVLRDNIVIHTGRIESLRRFKNDVSEVKLGFECGIVVANFGDVKQADVLEAFAMEKMAPELG